MTSAPGARCASVLRTAGLPLGAWLITLEAMTIGAANVLIPLRLSRFGASGVAIGATFVAAAALSTRALAARRARQRSSRHPPAARRSGWWPAPSSFARCVLPGTAAVLAPLSVIALGGPLAAYMIPAVSMMTASAEAAGIALVLVTTLGNLAYATGETIGAPVAAVALAGDERRRAAARAGRADAGHAVAGQPDATRPDQPSTTGSSVTSRATSAA